MELTLWFGANYLDQTSFTWPSLGPGRIPDTSDRLWGAQSLTRQLFTWVQPLLALQILPTASEVPSLSLDSSLPGSSPCSHSRHIRSSREVTSLSSHSSFTWIQPLLALQTHPTVSWGDQSLIIQLFYLDPAPARTPDKSDRLARWPVPHLTAILPGSSPCSHSRHIRPSREVTRPSPHLAHCSPRPPCRSLQCKYCSSRVIAVIFLEKRSLKWMQRWIIRQIYLKNSILSSHFCRIFSSHMNPFWLSQRFEINNNFGFLGHRCFEEENNFLKVFPL